MHTLPEFKWYPVLVSFPAKNGLPAELHEDEIKGESMEDAINRAYENWPEADVIIPDIYKW